MLLLFFIIRWSSFTAFHSSGSPSLTHCGSFFSRVSKAKICRSFLVSNLSSSFPHSRKNEENLVWTLWYYQPLLLLQEPSSSLCWPGWLCCRIIWCTFFWTFPHCILIQWGPLIKLIHDIIVDYSSRVWVVKYAHHSGEPAT